MEVLNGSSTTATGLYTHEAIYSNIPSQVDVCNVGDRNATVVGPLALQFIENYSKSQFFAFIHFSDPDSAGHTQPSGGENSALYENAIIRCDNWTGQILNRLKALNITQNTLVYVTADHGFDEDGYSHNYAPFISLATNDKRVNRNGDQVDIAPTIYYGLGMWDKTFAQPLDGYPLQINLPAEEADRRQTALADVLPPPKATISSPANGASVSGTVQVRFNASDKHLSTVLLLINNTLKADGPWAWDNRGGIVVANGSYNWDTTNINIGSYTIKALAFDENGATNSPSTSTITVNVVATEPLVTPSPKPTPVPTSTPTPPTPTPTPTPLPTTTPTALPYESPSTTPTSTIVQPLEGAYSVAIIAAAASAGAIVAIAITTVFILKKQKNNVKI
jgi:hypothetical protein